MSIILKQTENEALLCFATLMCERALKTGCSVFQSRL